ncbi:restriction endonuclease subunit R [Leptodesmis sichuanensis]|uniref:restriction endonuclease subunit R n=1 Tax=Leptodesmis sichuanensis TaxID=2906798 RepID=UPI001F404900|nr:restriction endonuclease subunit R [Leptodesmis sichuanensis]UIE39566.1 restriction endonuclease subunit R [Leptodesmis sichuanensis A121]
MAQTLQSRNVTIRDLIDQFGLQKVQDENFFNEWRTDLPELTDLDKQFLDKIKASFFNLLDYPPLSEKAIQLTILSPLLFIADFFLPPFHIKTEQSIEITSQDEGTIIRGQLDILLLKRGLWALVIESKQADFSVEVGLAQLISYLLAKADIEKPAYGMITNGASFLFIKVVRHQDSSPQYATSSQFDIRRPTNELYEVLKILKHLGQIS